MWYILHIHYDSPRGSQTLLHGCSELEDAQRIFDRLELSYQFNSPIRVRGEQMIQVTQVALYESFNPSLQEALETVAVGNATLMRETQVVEIDLES